MIRATPAVVNPTKALSRKVAAFWPLELTDMVRACNRTEIAKT
jgi:hypothetical protein